MALTGRTVLFFAGPLYEDLELWYPKIRLEEEGARTVVAGTGEKTYQGKRGYPLTVDTSDGTRYPTSAYAVSGGLRARIPVNDRLRFTGTVAYGMHNFAIADASPEQPKPAIPNVAYEYVRLGAGVRLDLWRSLSWRVDAAYLIVMGTGPAGSSGIRQKTRSPG